MDLKSTFPIQVVRHLMQAFSTLAKARITRKLGYKESDLKDLGWIPGQFFFFFSKLPGEAPYKEAKLKNYYSSALFWKEMLVKLLL